MKRILIVTVLCLGLASAAWGAGQPNTKFAFLAHHNFLY